MTYETTYRNRFESLVRRLRAKPMFRVIDFTIGEPVTDEEVVRVERQLGFSLDTRFVDYFRACNGFCLSWIYGFEGEASREDLVQEYRRLQRNASGNMDWDPGMDLCGSVNIPRLAEIFSGPQGVFNAECATPGADREPILGGFDAHELRTSLRWIDREHLLPEDDSQTYEMVALVAHPRFPDPVCLFLSDNAAALSDCHPMGARSYLELMLAAAGSPEARRRFRRNRGFSGNHAVTALAPDFFEGTGFGLDGYRDRCVELVNAMERNR